MATADLLKYASVVGAMVGGFAVASLFLWKVLAERLETSPQGGFVRLDALLGELKSDIERNREDVNLRLDDLFRRCERIESRIDGLYYSRD